MMQSRRTNTGVGLALRAALILTCVLATGACVSESRSGKVPSRRVTPSTRATAARTSSDDVRPASGASAFATAPSGVASSGAAPQTADTSPAGVALARLRSQAVEVLMSLVRSGSAEEKAHAIEALRFAPAELSQVAPEALVDLSPGVRGVTAMALAKSRVCTAVPELHQLLTDKSAQVRASAILALWRCERKVDPTPLAGMLKSNQPQERAQAAWVLGELGEESALPMLEEAAREALKRISAGAARVMDLQIAEARVKLGDEDALTDIRTALLPARNEDLESTALAASILGDLGDRGATNSLVYLVEYKDTAGKTMPPEVRLAAAGALAKLGQPQGGKLAEEFSHHADASVRAQSAAVLGMIRSTEYIPTLEVLMADQSGRVRAAAAMAILQTADSRGIRAAQP